MNEKTECTRETERKESDKEWLESRKSKRPKQDKVRKSKSKGQDESFQKESFIERQAENELEDTLVKTAFSTLP